MQLMQRVPTTGGWSQRGLVCCARDVCTFSPPSFYGALLPLSPATSRVGSAIPHDFLEGSSKSVVQRRFNTRVGKVKRAIIKIGAEEQRHLTTLRQKALIELLPPPRRRVIVSASPTCRARRTHCKQSPLYPPLAQVQSPTSCLPGPPMCTTMTPKPASTRRRRVYKTYRPPWPTGRSSCWTSPPPP